MTNMYAYQVSRQKSAKCKAALSTLTLDSKTFSHTRPIPKTILTALG
jgi:hypothetical protein